MKIIFVCTGNTCRSCMAESIFNSLNENNTIEAYSAGINIIPDSKISYNASYILNKKMNINMSNRNAVKLTSQLIEECDLILTMTSNIEFLLGNSISNLHKKIFNLKEFVGIQGDISDPFGGDTEVYLETFNDLQKSIVLLIHKLKEDKSIE